MMTTDEKIEEAEYNLNKLKAVNTPNKILQFELSNFLNSAQSILYHLLEEYNIKYGLKLYFVKPDTFRDKATKLNHVDAILFIDWYDKELEIIKNDSAYGFLITKSNLNVHKKAVYPKYIRLTLGAGTDPEGNGVINYESSYFAENPNQDIITVCQLFLDKLKTLVQTAHTKF